VRASTYIPFGTALPGLLAGWQVKLPLAVASAVVLQAAEHVAGYYGRLLDGDGLLVAACVGLFFLDTLSGIFASWKKGDKITSKGFRRSGWKAIEYSMVGLATTIVANASAHTFLALALTWWDEAWLMYVVITEGFSVLENMTGSRDGALLRIRQITALWHGRDGTFKIEELFVETPAAPPAAGPPAP
jgi:phage-related holin